MGYSYVRGNFLGGERSKFAQGRYDLPDYTTGLNVCINTIPTESGGTVRRPGTRFIAQTYGGRPARLFSFAFRNLLPYTIELTQDTMRLFATTLSTIGISPVTTNDVQSVASISAASPAEVTTASAHGWSTGSSVYFTNVGSDLDLLQNRIFVITVTATDAFTLADQVTGEPVDGSVLGALPSGVQANRIATLGSPFGAPGTATGIDQVRKVQAEKIAILLHPAVATHGLVVTTQPGATTPPPAGSFAQFSLAPAVFKDGPYLDQYIGTTVTNTGTSGSITLQAGGAAFPGFKSTDVGRLVRLFSQPAQWISSTTYNNGNVVAEYQDPLNQPEVATYYVCISAGTSTGKVPSLTPSDWKLVTGTSYAAWTWGVITAVNSPSNITVTVNGSALLYNTSTIYAWRLGAYGGENGYPTCGVYHEGRLWLAGAIGNRFDASVSNGISISSDGTAAIINFAPSDVSGAVGASNAIAGVCNAEGVNPILWMRSHQQGVIAGAQPGEWLIFSPSSGAIAPNNIAAHQVTTIGGLNIEAATGEHTFLFVHRYGRKIIEYFADVFSGKLSAPHLTWASKHLTKGGIQEIAYQKELVPTLWARVADALVGWVYKRDSLVSANAPAIAAGHRHVLGSGRVIESIATGPATGGTTDALLMVTNDPDTNVRYVEALTDIPDEGETLLDAQYVDCAVAPSWVQFAPTNDAPYGGMTLKGLWPINNKTVSAWIGGLDCGDYTVRNGQINIPFGDGISGGTGSGLLTLSYVQSIAAIPMWIGHTYTSQGQIVRPTAPAETGARAGTAFAKFKQAGWAGFQIEGAVTGSIFVGTEFDNDKLLPLEFRTDNDTPLTVLEQFSGIARINPDDNPTFDSMLCWQVTRPYPCNMIAVGAVLDTTDI